MDGFTSSTVPGELARRAQERPNAAAIILEPDGARLTYQQWLDSSRQVGNLLLVLGVRPHDRVLVVPDDDWSAYACAYVGIHQAGATAVPVLRTSTPDQILAVARRSGAVGILGGPHLAGWTGWQQGLQDHQSMSIAPTAVVPRSNDDAEILFTSGTTGVPKGVTASHASVLHAALGARGEPRLAAHVLPPATNGGQSLLMQTLSPVPHAMLVHRAFEPGAFLDSVCEHRADDVVLTPAFAASLVRHGPGEADLGRVTMVRSTSAPATPAVLQGLSRLFPNAAVVNMYTSTEAWPARLRVVFDPSRPGSLGRPRGGTELRIVRPDGTTAAPGESGDVLMRYEGAPQRRYFGDEKASSSVFLADGWVRTGDVGHIDLDGYFYLEDRREDVINVGGRKVSTLTVQAALEEHPDVAESAAFGTPHPTLGQFVDAAVVVKDGRRLTPASLLDFVAGRLDAASTPKRVLIVDALPRNEVGKVLKNQLRERAVDFGSDPGSQALAGPDAHVGADGLVAALASVWADVLGIDAAAVTPESDWFSLGGSSLEAAAVTLLVEERLERWPAERALHLSPTLREYAETVRSAPTAPEQALADIPRVAR